VKTFDSNYSTGERLLLTILKKKGGEIKNIHPPNREHGLQELKSYTKLEKYVNRAAVSRSDTCAVSVRENSLP
jgi:hypothetical protein